MRALRRIGTAGMGFLAAGCYTLQPARGTVPQPGSVMGFDITDAGRTALGGAMGPEIDQVEGRLLSKDSTEYVVGVSLVRLLRGGEQVWHGEPVHIKSAYVSSLYERRFSAGRSIALGAAGVGVIAAIATRGLLGHALADPGKQPGDTSQTLRRPRP